MKFSIRLTKKDLFVGLCCAVFVFASLGAIGSSGRRRAKEAVCLSNVLKWGVVWKSYTDDHDGYFPSRSGGETWGGLTMVVWPYVIREYDPDLRQSLMLCPGATKSYMFGGRCPFAAWSHEDDGVRVTSSYTINLWAADDADSTKFWRTPYVADAASVPLLLDGSWKDTEPEPTDEPWESREQIQQWCWEPNANEMKRVCIDRHGPGVNSVFLDLSGRKVGLKELWVIKWHRQWPEGRDHLPDWEVAAPWMTNFKDY